MIFSLNQLSCLVDLSNTTPEELRNRLTFSGFEVEGVSHLAEASLLSIGKILTCANHPDSDHLHLLTVDCGKDGIKNIVCGAPNARAGIKVIVALEGCYLPFLKETIKRGKIRGAESEGMCCSLLELGVSKDLLPIDSPSQNGIEELPEDAPLGEHDVLGYLGLNDTLFDINVLPNRPDCLSYYGMAREISALLGLKLNLVNCDVELPSGNGLKVSSSTDKCPRIDILEIDNVVSKKESPLYVRRTLEANGIRSLSPIVDLGNYVMLLSGQPLNMYDADEVCGKTYSVFDSFEGEFTCFDGKKLELKKGDIVISDDKRPMCLAGIMAGDHASINDKTHSIGIEFASFYHANIRRTSARLGLSSASSILFSKGRNPKMITEAIQITLSLLDDFFESYEVKAYSSFDVSEKENKPFEFSLEKLNARLGSSYTQEDIDKVLTSYRVRKLDGNMLLAPIDRVDLNEQCDIEEEVYRYYPAERITPSLEHFPITHGGLDDAQKEKRHIREFLVSRGLDEILSFTLLDEVEDRSYRVFSDCESYRIINPMTKDHEFVRSDLLSSMVLTMEYNIAHQQKDLALFEVSPIDTKQGSKLYLSIGLSGLRKAREDYLSHPYDFFDLKGYVISILRLLGFQDTRYRLEYSKNKSFHPNCSADIYFGKELIGTFGKVHPSVNKENLFLAELDLGRLLEMKGNKTKFVGYSLYPTVRRDLSFKLSGKADYLTIKRTIMRIKDSYVKEVTLFDDFVDKLTCDEYLGISVYLGKDDSTMNDAEISASLNKIVTTLKSELALVLKGE